MSHALVGGGETGDLMRSIDWSQTPVGRVEQWPASLRTIVNLALGSEVPIFVLWGPELVQFYNHGAQLVLGSGKHPAAMGQRARECWSEVWEVIWPMYEQVLAGGATRIDDGLLLLDRNGFLEECYFDYAYTPIRDESGAVAGILATVAETTGHVVSARRLVLLRELSMRTAPAKDVEGVLAAAGDALGSNSADLPFVLLYSREGESARLLLRNGLAETSPAAPAQAALTDQSPWPLEEVLQAGKPRFIEQLNERIGTLHAGAWPEPVTRAFLLPLSVAGGGDGVLVFGLSPRLPFDEAYRDFLSLLGGQLTADLARVRALEHEKQRAEHDLLISARARAETEAERQKQHELFMQAPVAIAIIEGVDLRFTFANPAYRALINGRDVVGKTLHEALPDIREQGFDVLLHRVMSTGEPYSGEEIPIKLAHHGEDEWLFLTHAYTPMRNATGKIMGVLVSCWDVTSQVQARQRLGSVMDELQKNEERLRLLVDASEVGTWELNLVTQELIGNDVFRRMFGVAPGELFDLPRALSSAHPDDSERVVQAVAASVAGENEGRYRLDHRLAPMPDCPVRWLEARGQTLFGPDGKPARFLGTAIDITARKLAEEERERSLQLEQQARHEAEEASRLKDEFLATVSHELRTPLNAMLGWANLLRSGTVPQDRQDRALETIERNARSQAQLIEDLLDMSRILSGKLRLDIEPLDLAVVVGTALDSVRPAASAKGIQLQPTLESSRTVMGDPNRLQQVVWNLLTNAVKFTPKGGRVQVLVRCFESAVELTVADTGQGIARDFLPHVFDRFRQADGGTTRAKGGLGLGLSIARQLVEMHGGTIAAVSEGKGRGASFTVRLPLSVTSRREPEPPASHLPPIAAASSNELDGLRLLVVDDEADAREMLTLLLESHGATVYQAASAAEGRQLFAAERPDVLVSDIGMPGENGYSLIASIRKLSLGEGGNVPAVALTAYARSDDRTKALTAGFTSHVAKPVEPSELIAVIASLARYSRPTPI